MFNPRHVTIFALVAFVSACATTPQLTQEEINEQFPALVELGNQLDTAKTKQINIMAPQGFEEASSQYEAALDAARRQDNETAQSAITTGMQALKTAQKNAETSDNIFAEVIQAREKAIQADADKLYADDLAALDSELNSASNLIEQNSLEEAKQLRPELRQSYADLELLALKRRTTKPAVDALAKAKENNADKLAPKTYKQAIEELRLSESILDVDRTDIDKASAHVKRATILSDRSNNIAEVVKEFDRRDFSNEEIVLWYQNELATASGPLGETRNFDRPNAETVNNIRQDINSVVTANTENSQKVGTLESQLAALNSVHEDQVADLKQQHSEALASLNRQLRSEIKQQEITRAEMAAMEVARESKFNRIQEMFDDKEANVFRQKNNVVLSVYGFDFTPGTAEIKPKNFALMDKIVKSIGEFGNSKVIVSGHTDITGTAERNQKLSKLRAQNVAQFLNEVGGIKAERLVAEGYGQTKPVASNETPEGRALNRRVDILIVNK